MAKTSTGDFLDKTKLLAVKAKRKNALKSPKNAPSAKLVIAFCGIFSSGKSSLLNELLKQDFKLPTGGEPVTKFVTRIEYGAVFKAYCTNKGKRTILPESTVKDIVRGKSTLPIEFQEIVLQMPADILKNGIVFLDTPGYEDDDRLEGITRKAVQNADIAVFCCNADHFGKRFEKEYLQELEDSLGNFLVVVNHADALHTDRDFEVLTKYVEETVAGRGTRKLRHFTPKTTFFTVGAGRYIDLDGLEQALQSICAASWRGLYKIKEYAELKRRHYALEQLLPVICEEIEHGSICAEEEYQALEREYKRAQLEYENRLRDVERETELLRGYLRDVVARKTDKFRSEVERLEKEKKHEQFVNLTTQFIKKEFSELLADIRIWQMNHMILKDGDSVSFVRALSQLLKDYKVPSPVGERIQTRGFVGKLAFSIIVSTAVGSLYVDDGYDTIYRGYAKTAKINFESVFLPKLDEIIEQYLSDAENASVPEMKSLDVSVLDRIKEQFHEWKAVNEEVNRDLEMVTQTLNTPQNILVCSTQFACGKATLFNALTRSEVLYDSSPLPDFEIIPTIAKAAESDKQKKITYTFSEFAEPQNIKLWEEADFNEQAYRSLCKSLFGKSEVNREAFPLYRTVYLSSIDKEYSYSFLPDASWSSLYEETPKGFIRNADAIVFVISARQGFLREDRRYIEDHFAGWQLENIFFVINDVNCLDSEDIFEKLKIYVREELKDVFSDKAGTFDQKLFDERVFYIDAYGSMNTRMGRETPIARKYKMMVPDESTGVPELERALYRYLA